MASLIRPGRRGVSGMWVATWLMLAPALPAQDAFDSNFSSKPAIEKRLAEVSAEIRDLPAGGDPDIGDQLRHLDALCQAHLSTVDFAAAAAKERDDAAATLRGWTGFTESKPYTVTMLDGFRETLAKLNEDQDAAEARIRILERVSDAASIRMDQHQQAQRKLQDAAGGTGEANLQAARGLELEQIASRIAAEEVARANRRLDGARALLAAIGSRMQLAALQVKTAKPDTRFTREELDGILATIADTRSKDSRSAAKGGQEGNPNNSLVSWKLEFLDTETEFWNLRFETHETADAKARKAAMARLKVMKTRVDDWVKLGSLAKPADEDRNVMGFDPKALHDNMEIAVSLSRKIGFAMEDLGGEVDHGTPVLDLITDRLVSLWNAELYLAKDTSFIDGQQVTTFRAVTLGKVVRLIIILVVGWFLLRMVSRWLAALVTRGERILPATARLIARWFFIAGFAVLLVYGMNVVHIPFTAFAFLGGALAIGVGFGAQTLLKNFISGLILIFERPIKVGDQVEVDGITGRIRSIGMRASVIQHYDGIDTLIPNSLLLENKLTNWTFSDNMLRQTVSVGVAYGSPVREVAKLLASIAREHGLVRDNPAPEVRLDDFGDNSLNFTLLFWFDAKKTSRATLASDLRFMIEKAFGDAGFIIAFPQQDIHFDNSSPLRVELLRGRSGPPPEAPPSRALP